MSKRTHNTKDGNDIVHWSVGVSKNMLMLEMDEAPASEEFIKSLDDGEMDFIADFLGQEIKERIGEDEWDELFESSTRTGVQAIKDIRSGKLKLDDDEAA